MAVPIALVEYTLNISVQGNGTTDPPPGSYTYTEGTVVTVTAYPAAGWRVDHWELDGSFYAGAIESVSITVDANHGLLVVFVEETYTLTISATAGGTTDPAPGTYTHKYDESVTITAIPQFGYAFSHWSIDGLISMTNPLLLSITRNYVVQAVFVEAPTATITGRVIDATTNEPIAGAKVSINTIVSTSSASDGSYSISVPIGVYTLRASAKGYYDWSTVVDVSSEGTYIVDIPMIPVPPPSPATSTITGTVTDTEGKVIAGATVTADGYSTITDESGKFTLTVEPKVYIVTVKAEGYKEWSQTVDASTPGTYVISPVLEKEVVIPSYSWIIPIAIIVGAAIIAASVERR